MASTTSQSAISEKTGWFIAGGSIGFGRKLAKHARRMPGDCSTKACQRNSSCARTAASPKRHNQMEQHTRRLTTDQVLGRKKGKYGKYQPARSEGGDPRHRWL